MLNKCLSFLLCLTLLLGLCAPSALAAGEESTVIRIYTAADLAELSVRCSLDSWSRDKTVLLEKDIDLSGTEFQPIPTFGGTFDGQGHTISGLSIPDSGSNVRGLFRYVQATGVIQDLTVEGSLLPIGQSTCIGGIAGSNSGTISRCVFRGTVQAEDSVGGIAGINEAAGQILNCTFSGSITGEHYVGGIVGQNLGSVVQCRSSGSINTTEVSDTLDLEDLDLEQLNSMENMPSSTDIGGIAGFSSGVIQSCRNAADVGYPHVGYNIGGIAGRQNGYLDGCANEGHIQGRKDVGGIAGQMEPQLILKYDQTALDQLWSELDTLEALIDELLGDVSGTADSITGEIQAVSDSAAGLKNAVADLSSAFARWADGGISQINDASARIAWILERMTSVTDGVELALDHLERAALLLADGLDEASLAAEYGADAAEAVARAMASMESSVALARTSLTKVRTAISQIKQALGDTDAMQQAWQDIMDTVSDLTTAFSGIAGSLKQIYDALGRDDEGTLDDSFWSGLQEDIQSLGTAVKEIYTALGTLVQSVDPDPEAAGSALDALKSGLSLLGAAADSLGIAAGQLRVGLDRLANTSDQLADAFDAFSDAGTALANAIASLEQAVGSVSDILEALSDMPALKFEALEGSVTDEGNTLNDAADSLLDSFNGLNAALRTETNVLAGDLQKINAQMGAITDLLPRLLTELTETDTSVLPEDVSGQDTDDSRSSGKISGCENLGTVEGDLNVAGIVGSVAIEYDFDPEDDLTVSGERTLRFQYLARAVVRGCVNRGSVTAKKNCVGGIAGSMDLGQVSSCESYGSVTSTSGGYVGGIAGASHGGILDSWVMCALAGSSYVGGIAGLGTLIRDCRTLVEAESGIPFSGAIAGQAEEGGALSGNLFVHHALAGVDGISSAGAAEPVSYGALCALEGLPSDFTGFELVFTADGAVVATISFQYGDSLDRLPDIPEKAGYSARWPELDYSFLTFSRVLEAEYTLYSTALSDGQTLPAYLVAGSFSPDAEISVSEWEATWNDEKGRPYQSTAYTVTVTDGKAQGPAYTLHWRLPEEGDYDLWILDGAEWVRLDYTADGSYFLLDWVGESVTFSLTERTGSAVLLYILLALAVILVILVVILIVTGVKRRKKRRAAMAAAADSAQ